MTSATNNPMVSGVGLKYELTKEYFSPGTFNLYHPLFPNSIWGRVMEIPGERYAVWASYEVTIANTFKYRRVRFENWEECMKQLNIHANRYLF